MSPASSFTTTGTYGGPFAPANQSYTIVNQGTGTMAWTASTSSSWLTLSATSGLLSSGSSATVIASVNSNANLLSSGSYSDTIFFTNATDGMGNTTRQASLITTAVGVLSVSPASSFSASGTAGVPFTA